MEMSNSNCGCPGLQLGHNRTRSESTSTAATTTQNATNSNNTRTAGTRFMVSNYARIVSPSDNNMRGNFTLPGYESGRLDQLPASPQTLFKKEQLLSMLDDFSKHMYDALLQNGIHVPPSITLGMNNMGDINLLGSHPDQSAIEGLFGNNSSLATQFRQIAFTSRIQQLAMQQPGFSTALLNYPTNSLAQLNFAHMNMAGLNPFQMTISQADDSTQTPALGGNSMSSAAISLFQLIISRSQNFSDASSSSTDTSAATSTDASPSTDVPAATSSESPASALPDTTVEEDTAPPTIDNQGSYHSGENIYTINDPAPPMTKQPETLEVVEHRHHDNRGKVKCVINS